jgi:hypothetical protein
MIFYYVLGVKQGYLKLKTKLKNRVKNRPMEIRPLIPRNPHFLREANYKMKKKMNQSNHHTQKTYKGAHEPLLIPPSSSSSFRRFGALFTNKYQINRQLPLREAHHHHPMYSRLPSLRLGSRVACDTAGIGALSAE